MRVIQGAVGLEEIGLHTPNKHENSQLNAKYTDQRTVAVCVCLSYIMGLKSLFASPNTFVTF